MKNSGKRNKIKPIQLHPILPMQPIYPIFTHQPPPMIRPIQIINFNSPQFSNQFPPLPPPMLQQCPPPHVKMNNTMSTSGNSENNNYSNSRTGENKASQTDPSSEIMTEGM